ncbi:MAG TPA: HXXEE domain-containing protein [Methanobacterium sp.]|nr:HXXEE domain-containing protein [Methanobacterium sp.]
MSIEWLYKNWAKLCLILSVIVTIIIFLVVKTDNMLLFLIWIQIPIYLLHQFEEHAWPGGFRKYVNLNIFKVKNAEYPLSDLSVFWINIPIIWVLMPIFAALSYLNLFFGLWIPYFAVLNSLTHVIAAIVKREYNPGLVVSLLLGIPVAGYALWLFYALISVPLIVTVISILVAVLMHLFLIIFIRKRFNEFKN